MKYFIVILFLLAICDARADLYTYKDENGTLHGVTSKDDIPLQYRKRVNFSSTPKDSEITVKQRMINECKKNASEAPPSFCDCFVQKVQSMGVTDISTVKEDVGKQLANSCLGISSSSTSQEKKP